MNTTAISNTSSTANSAPSLSLNEGFLAQRSRFDW
ncbi:MAG: hypothetical protein RL761_63, partial [Pseudomonadota bacterium]